MSEITLTCEFDSAMEMLVTLGGGQVSFELLDGDDSIGHVTITTGSDQFRDLMEALQPGRAESCRENKLDAILLVLCGRERAKDFLKAARDGAAL